jgi:hypothetical protein
MTDAAARSVYFDVDRHAISSRFGQAQLLPIDRI